MSMSSPASGSESIVIDLTQRSRSRSRSKTRVANPTRGLGSQTDSMRDANTTRGMGCQPDEQNRVANTTRRMGLWGCQTDDSPPFPETLRIKYKCQHCRSNIKNVQHEQPVFAKVGFSDADDFPFHDNCWQVIRDWYVEDKQYGPRSVDKLVVERGPRYTNPEL